MFLLEQVTGNLIGPYIEGRGMRLSALVVLFAVTFWGFLWGPIGALLAVPLTVALMGHEEHPSRRGAGAPADIRR
jgi:AI-2 transport protein TqsA